MNTNLYKYVVYNKNSYFIYGIIQASNSMEAIKEIRISKNLNKTPIEATQLSKAS